MTVQDNRMMLDQLIEHFKRFLHIEDPKTLYTLCASKASHRLSGDPVWLMFVGASSDGKSEMLKAFTQPGDVSLDDLTEHTFVSGYKSKDTDDIPQFAEMLANRMWYIYDMSILMSKTAEERSYIFSDMRMIYDGRLKKRFGNKQSFDIPTPNNTLVCGSTPVIDRTILEDQIMGTRFLMWRTKTGNRTSIMQKIDDTEEEFSKMRIVLNGKISTWYNDIVVRDEDFKFTPDENFRLQKMTNNTTLLRTSVDTDKHRELANLAYPEAPGRFYRQLKKMYKSYRLIGLDQDEAMACCQKLCTDCIIPSRFKTMEWLFHNNHDGEGHSLSSVSVGCQMGKGCIKSHLSALMGLGIVRYDEGYSDVYRRDVESWSICDGSWDVLFPKSENRIQSALDGFDKDKWKKVDPIDGVCCFCGFNIMRQWVYEGEYYCDNCHSEWS